MLFLQANFEAGSGNPLQKNEQVNYWPSTVEHTDEVESDKATTGREKLTGQRQRTDYGSGKENIIGDDFKQPGDRIRGFSQASRDNLLHHLIAWLTDPKVVLLLQTSQVSGDEIVWLMLIHVPCHAAD